MGLVFAKYTIKINGKKISKKRMSCINSVSIFETVDGSSTATLKIVDPDFVFINDNIFREEATIKIYIDWYGKPTRTTFSGYISAIKANFPQNGLPSMDITCMDITHKMNRKKRKKTFKNKSSRQVVKKIAKRYGFKVKFTKGWKSVKQESISQSNQTDIDLLTSLAGNESYPFAVYVRNKTLYYVRKGKPSKKIKVKLTYRSNPCTIIDFSPTITKEEVKKIEKKRKKTKKKTKGKNNKITKKSTSGRSSSGRSSGKSGGGRNNNSSSRTSTTSSTTKKTNKRTKKYNPVTKKWE